MPALRVWEIQKYWGSQRNPGEFLSAIEELVLIWNASEAEEWAGRIVWIPL